MDKLLTPKFLTKQIAERATKSVLKMVFAQISELKRTVCNVVVLVPGMKDDRASDYPQWPNYPTEPVCIYEHEAGEGERPHDFDSIAKCKALQLWTDRNDDRTTNVPHLLFPGDTPFWGGVKRRGIVVACSGVQPHFDKMISGMIADMIVALAHEAWLNSDDNANSVDFLT